ncbi:hypothetical protein GCM10011371_23270 [Novosphingobium marinum]|uniref:Nucleotide modification associated domain-containing protein n=2 Tax=Novosphingobium marinum TaxID=1514948 RepID=A0A7Z0BWM9_9SPHN|nr:hypothetical protein [Novosphingobium marinum]NYH96442.1 hypothetical protein [Novosphingobium marinum]GGC35258.1 hypothetical protein GCM10011371_23270 [Novosphingobium marinum]
MRMIFSRKGFDSTAGGVPSPIVAGRPLSLPIPAASRSEATYGALGHGEIVNRLTKGRIAASDTCHDDPMFADGYCWFGQCGAAQGHLRKQGVGAGDTFLFFGLFADEDTGEPHHRIFATMTVDACGSPDEVRSDAKWRDPPRPHPHMAGEWDRNNTLYFGQAAVARRASKALRLTIERGPLNRWRVPPWLGELGLSYHARPGRWAVPGELDSVKRGQEFVCDIGEDERAHAWLAGIVAEIGRG